AEIAPLRAGTAQAPGRPRQARVRQDRHRVGTPDPQLRARPVAHQGPAHRGGKRRHAESARRRPRRFHLREPEEGRVAAVMSDQPVPQDENQIIAERRAKLAELRKRGAAFPNDFRREHLAADLHSAWDGKSNEDIEPKQLVVAVAGRMMLKRIMGKASFATVQDMSGRIQRYVTRDAVGEAAYEAFKHYDVGDILGAKGSLFKTKTDELSLKVTDLRLLVKALR